MRVTFHTDYGRTAPVWPEDWPLPRIGDVITSQHGATFKVIAIDWYPNGEHDEPEPFVYIVLREPWLVTE